MWVGVWRPLVDSGSFAGPPVMAGGGSSRRDGPLVVILKNIYLLINLPQDLYFQFYSRVRVAWSSFYPVVFASYIKDY